MNKKKIVIGSMQIFFIFMAFLVVYLDATCVHDLEKSKEENVVLKTEIVELEKQLECLEETGNVDDNSINVEIKSIEGLEKELEEKKKKIEELESEIKTYVEVKEDWNKKIAELEK